MGSSSLQIAVAYPFRRPHRFLESKNARISLLSIPVNTLKPFRNRKWIKWHTLAMEGSWLMIQVCFSLPDLVLLVINYLLNDNQFHWLNLGCRKTVTLLPLVHSNPLASNKNLRMSLTDREIRLPSRASLILCPSILVNNWKAEVTKCLSSDCKCIVISKIIDHRKVSRNDILGR